MPGHCFNTLRPRKNERHFADDIFKWIFLNANVWIPIKISMKFVPKGPINNIPGLVQIMAWRSPGDKPLSEPMMVSLTTHICVTRPQWVNPLTAGNTWVCIQHCCYWCPGANYSARPSVSTVLAIYPLYWTSFRQKYIHSEHFKIKFNYKKLPSCSRVTYGLHVALSWYYGKCK